MRWNLTGRDGCFCRDHCDPRLRFCREGSVGVIRSQRTFCSLSLVYLFRAVPKLVAFILPIFRNVDGSWRVTSKLRGSTLIQVARRRSKMFQKMSASLVRCEVKKTPHCTALQCGFFGGLKKGKIHSVKPPV